MSEWGDSPASPLDLLNIHRGLGLADGFEEGGLDDSFEEGGLDDGFEEGGLDDGFEEGGLDDGFEEGGLAACVAFVNEVQNGQPSTSSSSSYLLPVGSRAPGHVLRRGRPLWRACPAVRVEPRAASGERRAGANASFSIRVPPSAILARDAENYATGSSEGRWVPTPCAGLARPIVSRKRALAD